VEAAEAEGSSSHVSLQHLLRHRTGIKSAGLQYSDLYGVPCILVLCHKGRMGDTFPQTFSCLDLRIRVSDNHTTFIQEIGRLCRYPACDTGISGLQQRQISVTSGGPSHSDRVEWLEAALKFAYSAGRFWMPDMLICGAEIHTHDACTSMRWVVTF